MSIAPGYHKARALDADFGIAKTGTRQVAVSFEITDGDAKGAHITWYGYFTQDAADRAIESLRHCGCTFPQDDITNLAGLGATEVELVIEEEPTDTGGRPKVRWVNRLGGGVALGTRMTDNDKRQFAAEMRGFVISSRPAGQGAPTTSPTPRPTSPAGNAAPPSRGNSPRPSPAPNGPRRSMNPADENPPY